MTLYWKRVAALTLLSATLATEAQAQRGFRDGLQTAAPEPQSDATRTKKALDQVLKMYPPSLKQVLQLDSSLLSNKAYLSAYPKLSDFLNSYPEVVRDPAFFIGVPKPESSSSGSTVRSTPQVTYVYKNLDAVAFSLLAMGVAGGIAWLVRATIAHQRWLRLSKGQSEAQAKILERFTSNEDLLNFIQTPAGRNFLEASSLPVQPKAVSAPISQILWSMQIGLVLFTGGIGLEYVSPQAQDGGASVFHMLGIVIMALGVGFVLSGVSSYILSRKFGLLNPTNATSQTPPS